MKTRLYENEKRTTSVVLSMIRWISNCFFAIFGRFLTVFLPFFDDFLLLILQFFGGFLPLFCGCSAVFSDYLSLFSSFL
ncbi:MAG TPA: hypothetical protein DE061_03350 [Clostridiales bacterium]|nr:hypothetical protein [Clostridiales bacterium]